MWQNINQGVLYRVEQLADRPEGEKRPKAVPYKSLVPLQEIIAESLDVGKSSKSVQEKYEELVKLGQSEFNILLNLSIEEIAKITLPKIAEGIAKVRKGELNILPGYDGVFGTVQVFSEKEKALAGGQSKLF